VCIMYHIFGETKDISKIIGIKSLSHYNMFSFVMDRIIKDGCMIWFVNDVVLAEV